MDKESRMKKTTKTIIFSIQNEIKSNPLKTKKISTIAKEAGINRKLLETGFKLLFEVTIKQYQLMRKLEHSQQLLDAGKLTIKEIAFICGYSSQNNFTKAFKKMYGQTPTAYQNRHEAA